jgi:hypothetical protein
MRYFFSILIITVSVLHGVHVLMLETGSIPAINSARPLSWSSLDRIAASGPLGKGAVLTFDCLLIAAGLKLLVGARRKGAKKSEEKRRN